MLAKLMVVSCFQTKIATDSLNGLYKMGHAVCHGVGSYFEFQNLKVVRTWRETGADEVYINGRLGLGSS
jgi:hypothetical protein